MVSLGVMVTSMASFYGDLVSLHGTVVMLLQL
jgi:hypothetical protein